MPPLKLLCAIFKFKFNAFAKIMIIVSMWMCAWVLFEVTFIVQQFCTR